MKKNAICAPSRIYDSYPGGHFSVSEMVDYMSQMGFDGIDMSFENIKRFDDALMCVLYSAANRASKCNLDIPMCHLPFYMPNPDSDTLMERFADELRQGIDAAAFMKIKLAVTHPIAYHSQWHNYDEWIKKNTEFLSPIIEYANKKNVKICIENMAGRPDTEHDHLYGSRAVEISILAEQFDSGLCWDFGHANLCGLDISEEFLHLGKRLECVHIHDNDGRKDLHLLPFYGNIDWRQAVNCLRSVGYDGCLDLEVKSSELPQDREVRRDFGRKALNAGLRLTDMLNKD